MHWQSKKKSRTYINFGNAETQAQKSLIPTQKPNRVDYKRYKGKRILKFGFICTINNGDYDAKWSMSVCLLTCMDNLLQTKHLIRPITMIIAIIKTKYKTRKWTPSLIINSLTHVYVSEKPLYSGWCKETMFCNYCRSISKALLNKELFHWCLSRILTIAIEHLVCGKPSKAMNHVLHYIYPFKNIQS